MDVATGCDHVHGPPPSERAVADSLSRAEARVGGEGGRWTEPRRRVYELLVRAGTPVKAYDLMARYADGRTAKPPTIYRALDFLEQAGLAHRIASLNAFLACEAGDRHHVAAFLICDCCGAAEEFHPGPTPSAIGAAEARGFRLREVAVEARGRCHACA